MEMDQQKVEGCAACMYMRRKCPPNCIFAPYFPATSPSFGYVHHVYGCSNVGNILQSLPVDQRRVAAETLAFEAEARIRDPVNGCVGYIFLLQQHLGQIDRDIQEAEAKIYAAGYQPLPPPEQDWIKMPQLMTTTMTVPPHYEQPDDLLLLTDATYPSPHHELPDDLLWIVDAVYPSTSQIESMSEMLPISSTMPQQDDPQLMTDAEIHDFAAELEDLLDDDGDIQEDEAQIPAAGYLPLPPQEQHSLQMPQMTTTTVSPHHELLLPTGAAYPSTPQAEPIPQLMSEMLPFSSTPLQQDDLQLMTDAEIYDFAAELEDLLS